MTSSDPTGNDVVENMAAPLCTGAVPSVAPASEKVTVPVGAAPPGVAGATVAVKVTESPVLSEGVDATSVVLEAAAPAGTAATANWKPVSEKGAPPYTKEVNAFVVECAGENPAS